MSVKKSTVKQADRHVVRKADRLIATLRNSTERKDFEQRLMAKCEEVGLPIPSMVPYGSGEQLIVACKSRDQAYFVQDYAEEAIQEMLG